MYRSIRLILIILGIITSLFLYNKSYSEELIENQNNKNNSGELIENPTVIFHVGGWEKNPQYLGYSWLIESKAFAYRSYFDSLDVTIHTLYLYNQFFRRKGLTRRESVLHYEIDVSKATVYLADFYINFNDNDKSFRYGSRIKIADGEYCRQFRYLQANPLITGFFIGYENDKDFRIKLSTNYSYHYEKLYAVTDFKESVSGVFRYYTRWVNELSIHKKISDFRINFISRLGMNITKTEHKSLNINNELRLTYNITDWFMVEALGNFQYLDFYGNLGEPYAIVGTAGLRVEVPSYFYDEDY